MMTQSTSSGVLDVQYNVGMCWYGPLSGVLAVAVGMAVLGLPRMPARRSSWHHLAVTMHKCYYKGLKM